jgi:hypothetical protein
VGKYSRIGDAQRIKDWLVTRGVHKPATTTAKVKTAESDF